MSWPISMSETTSKGQAAHEQKRLHATNVARDGFHNFVPHRLLGIGSSFYVLDLHMSSPILEFHFSADFQEQMLAMMLKDVSFAARVCKFIPEERLYAETYKYLYQRIKERAEKGEPVTYIEVEDHLKTIERRKRKMLRHFVKRIFQLKIESSDFIKDKLTDYAKKNAFIDVFQSAQTFWNSKRYEDAYLCTQAGINELYGISFKDDAIIPIQRFEEERQYLLTEALLSHRRVPTNIEPLDRVLRGGLEKGEFGIILAEPKKGKSIGLTHMGAMAVMMRMGRVAHFVLEGTTEQALLRYLSRLTQIEYHRLEKDDITLAESKKLDMLKTKFADQLDLIPFNQHWNYTVLDIEARLKELCAAGRKPDLVVIDYADLLKGVSKHKEVRHEQTEVYRDLKRLAVMNKYAMWTASQAQRPQKPKGEVEKATLLRARDIAECYEKVRIADLVVTLNQTYEEKLDGILRMHLDIYRSSDMDETVYMLSNYEKMVFYSRKYAHAQKAADLNHPWMKKR